mmetsp:Transcript_12202/g.27712  ORF Transcript_12202/g.27712 Transcript_12202/m.27712 type:complete len:213 (-) Transcript_12202:1115-1753(-)
MICCYLPFHANLRWRCGHGLLLRTKRSCTLRRAGYTSARHLHKKGQMSKQKSPPHPPLSTEVGSVQHSRCATEAPSEPEWWPPRGLSPRAPARHAGAMLTVLRGAGNTEFFCSSALRLNWRSFEHSSAGQPAGVITRMPGKPSGSPHQCCTTLHKDPVRGPLGPNCAPTCFTNSCGQGTNLNLTLPGFPVFQPHDAKSLHPFWNCAGNWSHL